MIEHRNRWIEIADALEPKVHARTFGSPTMVEPTLDLSAWQGWRARRLGAAGPFEIGREPVYVDFGTHLVGRVRFRLSSGADASRLWVRLGETLAEVCESPDRFPGNLGGQWLDAVELERDADGWVSVPGRRALRFAKLWQRHDLDDPPSNDPVPIEQAEVVARTTASWEDPPLVQAAEPWMREVDRVSLHTLRNCMHEVFEDGPKRDRRLWLGDLYLQAKAAYVTFGSHDLVKRCLYLFAGTCGDDGLVAPCVFAKPTWHGSHKLIPSYAWLFAPCLLDYVRASGDVRAGVDLFDLAAHQQRLFDRHANDDGVFDPRGDEVWRFIDWNDRLEPQIAEQAVAIFSLTALIELAQRIGREDAVEPLVRRRERLATAARAAFFDERTGLFVATRTGQVAWASQAWMVLAGLLSGDAAKRAMTALDGHPQAVLPVTPYMQHYVVEALMRAGLNDAAWQRLREFWGGMIEHGADTFWELYDPADPMLSPYGSHLHNSACHAWSCTPSWFIRARPPADTRPTTERERIVEPAPTS